MKFDGPMIGNVVNNLDPEGLDRVQVKLPGFGDRLSPWARLMAPRAGRDQGILFRPEIGDEVVIMFINGDVGEPVVLGGLWSRANTPPTALVDQAVIRTRSGHTIVFDDAHDAECIEITTAGGHRLLLTDESGGGRIEISNATGNGRIVISDDGAITIAADSENITISAGQGDVVIEGVNIQLRAQAQIDISGTAGVALETQAAARLHGALVQLDGQVLANGQPLI